MEGGRKTPLSSCTFFYDYEKRVLCPTVIENGLRNVSDVSRQPISECPTYPLSNPKIQFSPCTCLVSSDQPELLPYCLVLLPQPSFLMSQDMDGEGIFPHLCVGQGGVQRRICQREAKPVGGVEAASSRQRAVAGPLVGSGGAFSGPGG